MRRLRKWAIILSLLLLLFIGVIVTIILWPATQTFTISKETTYITEPVLPDGTLDYEIVLNLRLRGDIKPEENAKVLLWQAIGPHPEGRLAIDTKYFEYLQGPIPPEDGVYQLDWFKFWKQTYPNATQDEAYQQYEKLVEPTTEAAWHETDVPDVTAWLKANQQPLAVITEAVKRPKYYNPLSAPNANPYEPKLINALLPNVQVLRTAGNLLVISANMHIAAGEYDLAWQDLVTCQRLARHVATGGCMIELLVGIAIDNMAHKSVMVLLSEDGVTAEQIVKYEAEFKQLPKFPELSEKLDLFERFMILDVMQSIANQGLHMLETLTGPSNSKKPPFYIRIQERSTNWDPALKAVNEQIDLVVSIAQIEDRAMRYEAVREWEDSMREMKREVTALSATEKFLYGPTKRGVFMGQLMTGLFMPAFNKVFAAEDSREQRQQLIALAFTLAKHQRKFMKYPETLTELADAWVIVLPKVLSSGDPLKYQRTQLGYVLQSTETKDGNGKTIRIQVPVTQPEPEDQDL